MKNVLCGRDFMGFTIEDMLTVSVKHYKMNLIAGKGGWSNSISWLLMLEDIKIIQNFSGKELAVTTGLGFPTEDSLRILVEELLIHHASGLIVNTGYYIEVIPESVISFCDENDFPLITVPWDVVLADMIKDLSIRIFLQGSADEQISSALIRAIEQPDARHLYLKDLLAYFDTDGSYQVLLFHRPGLDEMDTVDRKRLGYRIQLYLANITHNGHFFYYDSRFVLVVNDLPAADLEEIVHLFYRNLARRMPSHHFTVGIGSSVMDISRLSISYKRAISALNMAIDMKQQVQWFDRMGIHRLLYSVDDPVLLREMSEIPLAPLLEYDRRHNANYTDTLELYLKHSGSIQAVASEMFTHRNTILYRMNNIRELLKCELETEDERLPYLAACLIRHMKIRG